MEDVQLWARAFRASMIKSIKSSLTERSSLLQRVTLAINYLILLILFVLSGSNAPAAVVLEDTGPYAQAFVQAMQDAHSFHVLVEPALQAETQMRAGTLVALVTIPSNFDAALSAGHPIAIPMLLNNLDEDLTDDARRGMGLAVTLFYTHTFPSAAPIVSVEQDRYAEDTGYIPFLAISIVVISMLVTGLLEGGMSAAREFEHGTIQVWKLAPAPEWVVQLGLMASSAVMSLPSVVVVLAVVVGVSGWPANPLLVLSTSLLAMLCFVAAGTALGTALKERGLLTIFARALAVPVFFLSGVFGAISFSTPAVMWVSRCFPVHYAIVLLQAGWRGFVTNTLPPGANAAIVVGFALLFIVLSELALRFSRVAHA